jgi:hypothetical protein
LYGIYYHPYTIAQDSMPSSVPWQSLRVRELCSSAARVLPPSALAALAGSYKLIFRVLNGPLNIVGTQVLGSIDRLTEACEVRQESGRPYSVLEHCTLHASVTTAGNISNPPGEHEVLLAWVHFLFLVAPVTAGLALASMCLEGLKAARALSDSAVPPEFSEAAEVAAEHPGRYPRFLGFVQQGRGSSIVGALLADAFKHLRSLELRSCNISVGQLEPLLSVAPVTTLKLTGGTQLGSTPEDSLQALFAVLSKGSIDHLEVEDSLWGIRAAAPQKLHPPRLPPSPPYQLQALAHIRLHNCGPLHSLVPLLRLMPSLTHLEVSHDLRMNAGLMEYALSRLLPDMPRLRTLLLPDSSYRGLFPPALLKSGSLQRIEVGQTAAGLPAFVGL